MFYFSKMQATGNDFIIINYLENNLNYSFKLLSKYLCDRHFGIGADGVLIIERSKCGADFKMRIFNSDGSEAEMCGNGIRCFSKYVYEKKLIHKEQFEIETLAGMKKVKLGVEGDIVLNIEIDMGEPIFDFERIPIFGIQCENKKINIENFEVFPISMGNPHSVCFVENVENIDVEKYGRMIENYKYFPNKTNVEFVQIINETTIKVRVWERGVGETLSCGTGACAAAVIASKYKSTNKELIVDLLGGNLTIRYDNTVKLIGTADNIFDGNIAI